MSWAEDRHTNGLYWKKLKNGYELEVQSHGPESCTARVLYFGEVIWNTRYWDAEQGKSMLVEDYTKHLQRLLDDFTNAQ